MNKLIIVFLLVFVGFLPLQVSAKSPSLKQLNKIQTCEKKTWKEWKKDEACMKLLKSRQVTPKDKNGKVWTGQSWKKTPRGQCGGYPFSLCYIPQA